MEKGLKILTTQVTHSDLELLPVPAIFPLSTVHPHQYRLQLRQPPLGPLAQEVLTDLVPVLLRYFALDAAGFDRLKPFVDGRVFRGVPVEDGMGCRPGRKDRLKVERLNLEGIENQGHVADENGRWK